jgi:AcrB/AcrD/AcrF family
MVAAVYFTPWIGYRLLKVHDRGAGDYNGFNSRHYRAIRALVAWCVRRGWLVVVLTFGALIASIASFALIPKQFFPTSNRPEILVDLWLPEGSSFEEVEREAKRLEQQLSKDPDLAYVATFIREGVPRFYLPLDQQLRNQKFREENQAPLIPAAVRRHIGADPFDQPADSRVRSMGMLPGDFQHLVDQREVGNACRHSACRLGSLVFLFLDQLLTGPFVGGLVLHLSTAMHKSFRRGFRGDVISTQKPFAMDLLGLCEGCDRRKQPLLQADKSEHSRPPSGGDWRCGPG